MNSYSTTIEAFNKAALNYHQKFSHYSLYNDSYDIFCSLIKKDNASILDVGCGPGNITGYLLSIGSFYRITAIDAAPNMIDLAKANNPTANCRVMDCRNIDQLNKNFEGIIAGFCIPYLSKEDCIKLIKDCSSILKEEGVFYISFIEGDYATSGYEMSSNGHDKAYVYYYGKEFFETQLSRTTLNCYIV